MRHIRPAITEDIAKSIACALVGSRLDYANSVLLGVSSKNVTRLQRAQNAAARVVVWGSRRRSTNSVGLLKQLHWLPVEWRIKFKIACITYKTISTTQPVYLYSSLKHYTPSCTLRSFDSKLLFVPRVRTCFGSRSFAVVTLTIWNFLPLAIRSSVSLTVFGANSKLSSITLLSGLLNAPPHQTPQIRRIRRVSRRHCALYKFTYLLTFLPNFGYLESFRDIRDQSRNLTEIAPNFGRLFRSSLPNCRRRAFQKL